MLKLIIVGVLAVAAFVVYKLWKSGKAVTASSVASGVESTVEAAASDVSKDVNKS